MTVMLSFTSSAQFVVRRCSTSAELVVDLMTCGQHSGIGSGGGAAHYSTQPLHSNTASSSPTVSILLLVLGDAPLHTWLSLPRVLTAPPRVPPQGKVTSDSLFEHVTL